MQLLDGGVGEKAGQKLGKSHKGRGGISAAARRAHDLTHYALRSQRHKQHVASAQAVPLTAAWKVLALAGAAGSIALAAVVIDFAFS